jgi:hypothetical protein
MRPSWIAPGLAIAALAVAGCGGDDYPDKVEKNFLTSCKSGPANSDQCECALDSIKDKFTYAEFKKEEADLRAGKALSKKLRSAVKDCKLPGF